MSHPLPGHDYTEKGKDESKLDYHLRKRKGMATGKPRNRALDKAKKASIKTTNKNLKDFINR